MSVPTVPCPRCEGSGKIPARSFNSLANAIAKAGKIVGKKRMTIYNMCATCVGDGRVTTPTAAAYEHVRRQRAKQDGDL